MKAKFLFLTVIVTILFLTKSYSQDTSYIKIELEETTLKNKHRSTAWRVDYYICTGIAYAKSMGQSVEDFTKFVGKRHSITGQNNKTLSGVVKTCHYVITSYPEGKYLYGHVAIMSSKISIDYKYEIKEDEVIQTIFYKK